MDKSDLIKLVIKTLLKDRAVEVTGYKYLEPQEPIYADITLPKSITDALRQRNITRLYKHQVQAIEAIRAGKNIVAMTPTASGKSLIYNIPVIESYLANQADKFLFVYPLKGLQQDQVGKLNALVNEVIGVKTNQKFKFAEVYDGDTSQYNRLKIRTNCPPAIFTNPDMLHVSMLSYHQKWAGFFSHLRYIIIDEIHAYRGVFGSNVCHVFRRLRRICDYYGCKPQFIACTATISNPKDFAQTLIAEDFEVIQAEATMQAGRHFVFVLPYQSPYSTASKILNLCVSQGLRSIVFTKARKITELIYKWTLQANPTLEGKISPYRSGFLSSERREIEQRLFSGELLGVVSTSALELGVDIGGLDVCIMCGYPGSISSLWQRAGRVGRGAQESLIVFIAIEDALDHYFVQNPDELFNRNYEAVTCDPYNSKIVKKHLFHSIGEIPLSQADKYYPEPEVKEQLQSLLVDKLLQWDSKSLIYKVNKAKVPVARSGIRTTAEPFRLKNERLQTIGDLDGRRIFRDAFPGAIYLHRGMQYVVSEFDLANRFAICKPTNADYYTQALSEEDVEIIEVFDKTTKRLPYGCYAFACRLKIIYCVTGFLKKSVHSGEVLSSEDLEMPPYIFETEGITIVFDPEIMKRLKDADISGSLHAVEHVSISAIPLFFLSDKADIGGYSYTNYHALNRPAIFIYDGYEGGIGLTMRLVDIIPHWLKASHGILLSCECEDGCPSCTHDPQCGSANAPLDKLGAMKLLSLLF